MPHYHKRDTVVSLALLFLSVSKVRRKPPQCWVCSWLRPQAFFAHKALTIYSLKQCMKFRSPMSPATYGFTRYSLTGLAQTVAGQKPFLSDSSPAPTLFVLVRCRCRQRSLPSVMEQMTETCMCQGTREQLQPLQLCQKRCFSLCCFKY